MHKEIQKIVDHSIQQIPQPILITITAVYEDDNHVDAKTKNDEELNYIPTIGTPTTNSKGVLLFLENNDMIIITGNNTTPEETTDEEEEEET